MPTAWTETNNQDPSSASASDSDAGNGWAHRAEEALALVTEAIRNINSQKQLHKYERRLAMRQAKEVLEENPIINEDLGDLTLGDEIFSGAHQVALRVAMGASDETQSHFQTLQRELRKRLRESQSIAEEMLVISKSIGAIWDAFSYRPTTLLETRIKYNPAALDATVDLHLVCKAILSVWEIYQLARTQPKASDTVEEQIKDQRRRLGDLLTKCNVSEVQKLIVFSDCEKAMSHQDTPDKSLLIPIIGCISARVSATFPQMQKGFQLASQLPDITQKWNSEAANPIALPADEEERQVLLKKVQTLLTIGEKCEYMSAVPFAPHIQNPQGFACYLDEVLKAIAFLQEATAV